MAPSAKVTDFSSCDADASAPGGEFCAFFKTHYRYVGSVGRVVLGDDELEDLVQDVFLIAHKHRHRVREHEALRGWLATITVREGRRRLRKRKVRAFLGMGSSASALEPHTVPDERPGLDARMRALALERALDRLPADDRAAWALRVEGYPLEEVATMCECSLATVKRRISRAQTKLEGWLGDGAG